MQWMSNELVFFSLIRIFFFRNFVTFVHLLWTLHWGLVCWMRNLMFTWAGNKLFYFVIMLNKYIISNKRQISGICSHFCLSWLLFYCFNLSSLKSFSFRQHFYFCLRSSRWMNVNRHIRQSNGNAFFVRRCFASTEHDQNLHLKSHEGILFESFEI